MHSRERLHPSSRMLSLARVALVALVSVTLSGAASRANGTRSTLTPVIGPNVDVSRAPGPQAEVRIAADPRSPTRLLAASNSDDEPGMRVYSSSDAGQTWTSQVLPNPPGSVANPCHADPAPAISGDGTKYVAYIQAAESCEQGGEHVTVRIAYRSPDDTAWRYWASSVLAEDPRGSFDDNPWLAVDTDPASPYAGRLYLAWFRSVQGRRLGFQLSFSDDRGTHWSDPRVVSDDVADPGYPSLSIGMDGTVYAAWQDFGRGALYLDRSTDGGRTFGRDVRVPIKVRDVRDCPNGRPIPAQRLRCVRADPTVIADSVGGRVYLTYSDLARNGSEDVFVADYNLQLRRLHAQPLRLGARERKPADQFWPTSVIDPLTGRLWVCFYDTRGDIGLVSTRFSCTVAEAGGRRWSPVFAVASVQSNATREGATDFAYGDYEGLAIASGVAHPVWTDMRDAAVRGEEIYTAAVTLPPTAPPTQVDVSRAPGSQNEPAIALDPSNPSVLIASSNSLVSPMSVYTSTDGGRSWSSQTVPDDKPDGVCVGDPGVAIDSRGHEYFVYLRDEPCGPATTGTALFVATRDGPRGPWRVLPHSLAGPLVAGESNDKPAIAVDLSPDSPYHDRAYVAWARAIGSDIHTIVISHTDDGGATWSAQQAVSAGTVDSGYPSVATGPAGQVYVAWHPFEEDRTVIAASTDGGERFGPERTIDVKRNRSTCPASWPIPAQARRCVRPNPIVSVDLSHGSYRGHVYVTYGNQAGDGTQKVYVAVFDPGLTPLLGAPAGHPAVIGTRSHRVPYRTDSFWAVSAVNQSDGTLWACFYDTTGDRSRRRTWFSCGYSTDGGVGWSPVERVATAASDATAPWISPFQYGDYEALAVSNGIAHPAWTDTRRGSSAGREDIYTAAVLQSVAPVGDADRFLGASVPTPHMQELVSRGRRSRALSASALAPRSFAAGPGRLAFSAERNGNTDIYAINVDGTGLQRLTTDPADDLDPSWSPDGTRIAFRSRGRSPGAGDQLYVMNADGSDHMNLTHNAADNWSPAWSPDGSKIAFASSLDGLMNVYVMNLDGTGLQRLTQTEGEYPSWSRDGKRIAYASGVGPSASDYEIWTMNADGSHQRQLTHNNVDDSSPTWSPDGHHIAFDSQRHGRIKEVGIGPEFEIYVMNANGSKQKPLTRNHREDRFPAWSPDGQRIAWTQDGTIMLMNADGARKGPLKDSQGAVHGQFPDWHPVQ